MTTLGESVASNSTHRQLAIGACGALDLPACSIRKRFLQISAILAK